MQGGNSNRKLIDNHVTGFMPLLSKKSGDFKSDGCYRLISCRKYIFSLDSNERTNKWMGGWMNASRYVQKGI